MFFAKMPGILLKFTVTIHVTQWTKDYAADENRHFGRLS